MLSYPLQSDIITTVTLKCATLLRQCKSEKLTLVSNVTFKESLKSCYVDFFIFVSRVMVKDPFHANCLPVHIGTLVELSKANGMRLNTDFSFN